MTKRIQCNRCARDLPDELDGAIHIAACRSHNGWTNYETWLVSLWIDNDRGSYERWREVALESLSDNDEVTRANGNRGVALRLADQLKEEHEEAASVRFGSSADVFTDLLSASLSEVAWLEVAEHLLAE